MALFRNSDEVRYVRGKLEDTMSRLFEKKGYIVLQWIDSAAMTTFGGAAFKWYTRFKYMGDFPLANVIQALIIIKEIWDKASPGTNLFTH